MWTFSAFAAVGVTKANATMLARDGAVSVIAAAMRASKDEDDLQLEGLRALYAMVCEDPVQAEIAVDSGIEKHLLERMSLWMQNDDMGPIRGQLLSLASLHVRIYDEYRFHATGMRLDAALDILEDLRSQMAVIAAPAASPPSLPAITRKK